MRRGLLSVVLISGLQAAPCSALAQTVEAGANGADGGWQLEVASPIAVRSRPIVGTRVKEYWAEGTIAAPLPFVQEALMEVTRHRTFMPFITESKLLGSEADGSVYVYAQLNLPVVSARDYVVQVWNDEVVSARGGQRFRSRWRAAPDKLPEKEGLVRVKLNSGSWNVSASDDGKYCHAVYRFSTDPGGWLPQFAVDLGNEKGVADTFSAIEREALRLEAAAVDGGTPLTK